MRSAEVSYDLAKSYVPGTILSIDGEYGVVIGKNYYLAPNTIAFYIPGDNYTKISAIQEAEVSEVPPGLTKFLHYLCFNPEQYQHFQNISAAFNTYYAKQGSASSILITTTTGTLQPSKINLALSAPRQESIGRVGFQDEVISSGDFFTKFSTIPVQNLHLDPSFKQLIFNYKNFFLLNTKYSQMPNYYCIEALLYYFYLVVKSLQNVVEEELSNPPEREINGVTVNVHQTLKNLLYLHGFIDLNYVNLPLVDVYTYLYNQKIFSDIKLNKLLIQSLRGVKKVLCI
jgi:hypothetical protein